MIHLFKNTLNNTIYQPSDGLKYWREKIFLNILLVLIIIGAIAVSLGVTMALKSEYFVLAVIDATAYLLLLFIFFNRSVELIVRIKTLIYMFLLLSMLLLIFVGHKSPWQIYLVGYNLLTALLLGLRSSYKSLILTLIIIGLIALSIALKIGNPSMLFSYTTPEFIAVSINILVISSISSIPLAMLVKGLKETIDTQKRFQILLKNNVQELSRAKLRAEEADKLKSSFLANMSHEIRTPLNAIIGFSSLLMGKKIYPIKEQKELVNIINESGEYLLNLIKNILEISIIEAKQLKINNDVVELSSIINELRSLYDPRINTANSIALIFDLDFRKNHIQLRTDSKRLKQVFINLINNAIKYTVKGSITVGFTNEPNFITFWVCDTGKGIEQKNHELIFERFVKVEGKYSDQTDGTGLGLPISKGIVEALGGKIWVESELDKGSTFYFTLPKNQ